MSFTSNAVRLLLDVTSNGENWCEIDAIRVSGSRDISVAGKFSHLVNGLYILINLPWTSYQIRKIAGCACARNAGNVFPRRRFQSKPLVSDPGMHHGTCVTHVPWCMSESLTCGDGENVPGIPGACAPAMLRIWQEAHGQRSLSVIVVLSCSLPFYWNTGGSIGMRGGGGGGGVG